MISSNFSYHFTNLPSNAERKRVYPQRPSLSGYLLDSAILSENTAQMKKDIFEVIKILFGSVFLLEAGLFLLAKPEPYTERLSVIIQYSAFGAKPRKYDKNKHL